MSPESLLRFARAYCARQLPWFAPALFRCRIQLTEKVALAAIDTHFNIYFNPEKVQQIDERNSRTDALEQLGFIWIHEIAHVLREHSARALERQADAELWNVAADLEINDSIWPGLTMPLDFPGLLPAHFGLPNGQLTEFYYQKLENHPARKNCSCCDEGSGVHGQGRPWEISDQQNRQELDRVETEMIRRAVAQEIRKHSRPGRMPGGWDRWAAEKLQARVDWRRALRHRMSVAINQGIGNRVDYSYRRPSRRQSVFQPILPPALSGDLSARVACVVDTSGSMTPQQLAQVVGEVCAVLQVFRVPVTILPCDAQAYEPIRIASPKDYFKLQKLPGGGGTNMIAGIEAAMQLQPRPDSILVLTDGYTPYPTKLYPVPVVFGIFNLGTQPLWSLPPNPPWTPDRVVEIR